MITLRVIKRDGLVADLDVDVGANLMESLRDGGFEDVLALCGGCCSCATCHVYIETGPEKIKSVGSEDEDSLLESSDHRQANSRLSCQISVAECFNGITIRIAPED